MNTLFKSLLAILGVPLDLLAISIAPSSSMGTFKILADLIIISTKDFVS